MSREVTIIDTGLANLSSVESAFVRLGATTRRAATPEAAAAAERLVLPGVGAFGPGLAGLRARGFDVVLRRRAAAGRPLLAVCLGLQMLCAASDEAEGCPGLGVIAAPVRRLPRGVRVPNMGWCAVGDGRGAAGYAYFAHSYAVAAADAASLAAEGWSLLLAEHGTPFVAAARRAGVLACQFHPELSGSWGAGLLAAWLENPDLEADPWRR